MFPVSVQNNRNRSLFIGDVEILFDEYGRANLNDLRRAGGFPESKKPSEWVSLKSAKDLISELLTQSGDLRSAPIETQNGGANPGIYAVEELAIAYANWLSPAFYLIVIRTFMQVKTGGYPQPGHPKLLTVQDRLRGIKDAYYFLADSDLVDDFSRVITRENVHNIMRELGSPSAREIPQLTQSAISNYFQIEDLRSHFSVSEKDWFKNRSACGKVVRAAIQAVDPECQPLKISKFVNGEDRPVNAWPNEFKEIAIAAIERYFVKVSV